jgi:hypothetical protein
VVSSGRPFFNVKKRQTHSKKEKRELKIAFFSAAHAYAHQGLTVSASIL